MRRVRFTAVAVLGLSIVLLIAACDSQPSTEQPSAGDTPATTVDRPDVTAPPSTEAPTVTESPATTAGESGGNTDDVAVTVTTDDGGTDSAVIAAVVLLVILVGIGSWLIGRSGRKTDTTTSTLE